MLFADTLIAVLSAVLARFRLQPSPRRISRAGEWGSAGILSVPSAGVLAISLAVVLGGCGQELAFGSKQTAAIDPNVVPTRYKDDLLSFLKTYLTNPAAVRDAQISEPALKPFGSESRYVVCVRYNDGERNQEKMAVYFGGSMNQFVDSTGAQCGGVAYQPFPEMQTLAPKSGTTRK